MLPKVKRGVTRSKNNKIKPASVEITGLPSVTQKRFDSIKDLKIEKVVVSRSPIQKVLNSFLNVLSLGQWNQLQKKAGYDNLFHLRLICYLEDGTSWVFEKNQNINIERYKGIRGEEQLDAKLVVETTVQSMFEKALRSLGEKRFYHYTPFNNEDGTNCQGFVDALLKGCGIVGTELNKFVNQDAETIIKKSFPDIVEKGLEGVLDFASEIDKKAQSIGLKLMKKGGVVTMNQRDYLEEHKRLINLLEKHNLMTEANKQIAELKTRGFKV